MTSSMGCRMGKTAGGDFDALAGKCAKMSALARCTTTPPALHTRYLVRGHEMQSHAIRKQALSVYADLYKFFQHDPSNPFTCFYCGEPASTIDHVPPISRVDDYRAFKLRHEFYLKVPCCKECNSTLQDSLQMHIIDRTIKAHELLERRYKKHLKCKAWTKEALEYAQFTGKLRKYILASEELRKHTTSRCDYWKGVNAFLAEFDPDDSIDLEESKYYQAQQKR